jgi:hypothetical protein
MPHRRTVSSRKILYGSYNLRYLSFRIDDLTLKNSTMPPALYLAMLHNKAYHFLHNL